MSAPPPADLTPARFTDGQQVRALAAMRSYLDLPRVERFLGDRGEVPVPGETLFDQQAVRDGWRAEQIDGVLGPLLGDFLAGRVPLAEFKTAVDSENKKRNLQGFGGMKGQMFFNMLFNCCVRSDAKPDEGELAAVLKETLPAPADDAAAVRRADAFAEFVTRVSEEWVAGGGSTHAKPKGSGVGMFVSYFWHVGGRDRWPVYFTNSVQWLADLDLWEPTGRVGDDLAGFAGVHHALAALFAEHSGRDWTLYDVEHVLSQGQGNPAGGAVQEYQRPPDQNPGTDAGDATTAAAALDNEASPAALPEASAVVPTAPAALPESWIPPRLAVLPRLAANDPELEGAAAMSGTSLPRALERSVNDAFSLLRYHTELLGQGIGRREDGRATSPENQYMILWDAKAAREPWSMGTEDRKFGEYARTAARNKPPGVRHVYFAVVSAAFRDGYEDALEELRLDTDLASVVLIEADALLAAVEAQLRRPLESLTGRDGLQRLLLRGGRVTADDVRTVLN